MQPLTIISSTIIPFSLPFVKPFTFAGNTLSERVGYYLEVTASDGAVVRGEVAPLPGVSEETLKKAKHDLEEVLFALLGRQLHMDKDELIKDIRKDQRLNACCASVRFGVQSVLFLLAAHAAGKALPEFLGASVEEVASAALLQGTHEQVMADAEQMKANGYKVFKLKVGDRNIPLDVKKVQGLRTIIGKEGSIRLDANRVWSLSEAILFAQLIGPGQIEFIEEPVGDMSRLTEFYQSAHIPVALDETLDVLRCGVTAPGRCTPTLAANEGVKAYVIKPSVLGGILTARDWIEEARQQGKKAVISSAFESPVGLNVLGALAAVTGNTSGLGTQRWFKSHAQ